MKREPLAMGKTPRQLLQMGVAKYHIASWIIAGIEKYHPGWYCLWAKYYYDNYKVSGEIYYLNQLFDMFPNCFNGKISI